MATLNTSSSNAATTAGTGAATPVTSNAPITSSTPGSTVATGVGAPSSRA